MSPGTDRSSTPARVTVVVVTHRGSTGLVGRCLESLRSAGGVDHLIVVDNSGSGDAALLADAWLRVDNEGFGSAVNRGIAVARQRWGEHQYIAVLNDDTRVGRDWLGPLVGALDSDPGLGAVQPKLLLADTVPIRVNSVGVELDRASAGVDVGFSEVDGPRWNQPRDIEIFTAGAVLFRLDFFTDAGGFDERYFLYYEDVDLALRGAELGWRYRCEPSSTVEHWPGSSTSDLGSELRMLQERNRLWVSFRFGSIRLIGAALWLSIRRLRHAPRRAHLRALTGGMLGTPARLTERRKAQRH